ncbi:DUF4174 domain-containing protein [Rhodovulum euryhalinum]|uniref:Uncharacterized protein DUF4174 n=1 Tax=Rhodovulum euryhalinum TaxID=35805 RepID=A0A4R2KAS5_9RHOB|nr:DUF4174 domain-containing protein [Rhodovulum euryhalinum]TCO69292.1 uncharacterized protein DUF4174 [Rhodovulum euryhalinum]
MKYRLASLALAAITVLALPSGAVEEASALARWQEDHKVVLDARDVTLAEFQWIARPVVVFADSPADPRFREQMEYLTARMDELALRDVVVIVDTDPAARTELRLALRPRGFMLAILGKDGRVNLRKPAPWDVREISRSIDKMPLRQQEIRDRHGAPPG